jgi:MFS family permease
MIFPGDVSTGSGQTDAASTPTTDLVAGEVRDTSRATRRARAMWGSMGAFISGLPRIASHRVASLVVVGILAAGSAGCLVGGARSDRIGSARTAALCLVCSGTAALTTGGLHRGPSWLVIALRVVWGFSVIADPAQLSAVAATRADPRFVASTLAFQLALCYLAAAVSCCSSRSSSRPRRGRSPSRCSPSVRRSAWAR